jgi:hypothetical protein
MDPISIAMGLATVVPDILKWFGHDNASATAAKVVSIAQKVTSTSSGDAALAAIQANPTLALQLQQEIDANAQELAKISQAIQLAEINAEVAEQAQVNNTMQVEAKADHWPTYTWRPFIGFIFGIMLFGDYFVIPLLRGWWPAIVTPTIPSEAWVAIGGILGVASYFRGSMQANPNIPTDNRG